MERLSSNKYALMHQKDEQKAIDRVEHVRENFLKMPYTESAKRLGPFSNQYFQLVPSHWSLNYRGSH